MPQQEAWVIERFGKYNTILEPVRSFVDLRNFHTPGIQSVSRGI